MYISNDSPFNFKITLVTHCVSSPNIRVVLVAHKKKKKKKKSQKRVNEQAPSPKKKKKNSNYKWVIFVFKKNDKWAIVILVAQRLFMLNDCMLQLNQKDERIGKKKKKKAYLSSLSIDWLFGFSSQISILPYVLISSLGFSIMVWVYLSFEMELCLFGKCWVLGFYLNMNFVSCDTNWVIISR